MQNARTESHGKRLIALVFAAVLALGMFAVAGCSSNNDEQVIRDGIAKELDVFKNPTKEALQPYMDQLDSGQMAQLEAYGIDLVEFLQHALGKFDYEIGDITVDGDKATAALTVTNIDVATITNDTMTKLQSDPAIAKEVQDIIANGGDQKDAMAVVFGYLYDALDAATDTITTDTEITLTKTDNTWNVDQDSMSGLLTGIYGNIAG
ncbi:MAG: hypothetical protein Q4C36_06250 [Coriobacteriia bacterium]|nr:hypothetical protein [Coriobacteriia bacterium]